MNCEQIRELLEAHAVGALDATERTTVEQHLAVCGECQRLAAEYADLVSTLPRALVAASPPQLPASLKSRLLQAVESSSTGQVPAGSLDPHGDYQAAGLPKGARRGLPFWRGARWSRLRTITLAATLVLLILSLAWSARLSVALARERALRAEFADLVSQQELVLEIVDSNKTVRHLLLPPNSASTSYGKLFTRSDMSDVVAMAARLPQPPPGHAYHLWVTSGGQTQLAGVLAVNNEGFGLLLFDAGRNGPTYDAVEVTLQPLGSTTPADPPVLLWDGDA